MEEGKNERYVNMVDQGMDPGRKAAGRYEPIIQDSIFRTEIESKTRCYIFLKYSEKQANLGSFKAVAW